MTLLNELMDDDLSVFSLVAYQRFYKKNELVPFLKGDVVYLSEDALIILGRKNFLDDYTDKDRRVSTFLSNVNRKGVIRSISKKSISRSKGSVRGYYCKIVVVFDDHSFVSIYNHDCLEKATGYR